MAENKNDVLTTQNFYQALEELQKLRKDIDKEEEKRYYVYFKPRGSIICVSPVEDDSLSEYYEYALFPYETIKGFLIGDKDLSKFIVKKVRGKKNSYKIENKVLKVNFLRSVDDFLVQISDTATEIPDIIIENDIENKRLLVTLNEELKNELRGDYAGELSEETIAVKGIKEMELFFTMKDNPLFLVDTVKINLTNLIIHGQLNQKYDFDSEGTSLFTKKVFETYVYTEKHDE